ncbi:MAG: hypothetical protein Q7J34_13340 [Bacteroidales bacterium]|nr:hypothetical protein [Bacteroidales bacterium]
MKTFKLISFIILSVGLATCTTGYMGSVPYDDVYYSSNNTPPPANPQPAVQSSGRYSTAPDYRSNNQNNNNEQAYDSRDYSTNQDRYTQSNDEFVSEPDRQVNVYNYYDDDTYNNDDYYDYAYSARIKRFHTPSIGIGYYDDYYTNLYWYNHNPYSWGTSIYMGYNFWGGAGFNLGWSWGWGSIGYQWGYPYSGWYSNPWAYNYYGYPYGGGWGGYWNGYNHGYWNGYYGGYYGGNYGGNYYNSYDANSHYYGPRHNRGSSNGAFARPAGSFGDTYESKLNSRRIAAGGGNTPGITTGSTRPKFAGNTITERRKQASGTTANERISPNARPPGTSGNANVSRIDAATNTIGNQTANPRIKPSTTNLNTTNSASTEVDGKNISNSRVRVNGDIQQSASGNAAVSDDPPTSVKPVRKTTDPRLQNIQSRGSNTNDGGTPQRYNYSRYSRSAQDATPRTVETPAGRDAKTYTPPVYTQPRSSNEYSSPRSRVVTYPESGRENQNSSRDVNSAPAQNTERRSPVKYQSPQENQRRQQPATQPRKYNTPTQSQPSRSYNPPSNQESRSNYQAPARSNESYSSPARSNNNSSSTPSRSSSSSYSSPSKSSSSGSSNSGSSNSGRRK